MDDIVLPRRSREETELLVPANAQKKSIELSQNSSVHHEAEIRSPQDALQLLKSKPSLEVLSNCLEYLESSHGNAADGDFFHIRLLGPQASQVVFVTVNDIVPSFWPVMSTDSSLRKQWKSLVRSLRSIAGIGAVSTRLKALCRTSDEQNHLNSSESRSENIHIMLQVLECILNGDKTLSTIWKDVVGLESKEIRRPMAMDQLSSFIAGGSVLSAAAEAETKAREGSRAIQESVWVADGRSYASWLGRNLLHWSREIGQNPTPDVSKVRDRFMSRSLSLGYNDQIAEAIFQPILRGDSSELQLGRDILAGLTGPLQSSLLNSILKKLEQIIKSGSSGRYFGGVAAVIHGLTKSNAYLREYLIKWLIEFPGNNVSFDLGIFRAVIASLASDVELLKRAQTSCLTRFGSKLHIRRDPILHQERQAQILLLITGKLFRIDVQIVKDIKHSSLYLDAISNRLAASSSRSQFLGMVTGMAISNLVDEGGKKLVFSTDEIKSEDGEFYKSLISLDVEVGDIADLQSLPRGAEVTPDLQPSVTKMKPMASKLKISEVKSKIVAIEEVTDSEESEDDLPVYAKPDSDAEDEDEDATLINRDKPIAPVYIRDLITGLRDQENYDRHKLAVETAPNLIRRKSKFGTEVTDHLEDLATQLVGIKDDLDLERFQELRLQAMIATIVAKPEQMGPWFANTFFNGEYSMSQRASILTALTLAARELAGFKDEDSDLTGAADAPSFPSKRLPAKYEAMYLDSDGEGASSSSSALPVTRLSGRLERSILQPLAQSAADAVAGPNALKVRAFSSRLDRSKQAARTRTVPNQLARLLADAFFFPLTARWRSLLAARGHASAFSTPFLLAAFVRTLALLLAAAGPGTLSLHAATAELWALLLGLRGRAAAEPAVAAAMLLGFLTLLELHVDRPRDVARDFAEELVETRAWVADVLDGVRGGGGGGGDREEERIRVLAAGVMVKAEEITEKYRKELLGTTSELL